MRLLSSISALLTCATGLTSLAYKPAPAAIFRPPHPTRTLPQVAETGDATLSPYFFVKSEDPSLDQLPLKSTSAQVSIAGVIADVRVTQIYKNTGTRPLEAIYVFPGSTRSAVYGLRMTIGERTIDAKIREKEQARKDYEAALREGRTASLLEQQRPNVFQMNVANILPGDEIRVELSYTELLTPTEGIYSFVYPTVVGPRYSGKPGTEAHTGEKWVANPYTKAGVAPFSTFDLDLRLAAGMPIQKMACTTHRNAIDYTGPTQAHLRLDASEAQGGNRDFILRYQLAGGQVQSGLLLHKGKDENFFLLMAQPPKRVAPQDMPGREFVFIMDVSGSQMGFPIEVSKVLMKDMIQGLRPQDRFNVMVFEGSSALLFPSSQPASPEHLQKALEFVGQQNGGGGTELGAAMRRALTLPRTPGFSRTFAISTDGFISADGSLFDIIRDHLGEANLLAFGIGSSVNRHLIEGMAHVGMGEAFVVTKPEEATKEAERFRAYVSTPVLTNVKVATNGFRIYDVEPLHLPDVLAERPVICFGKWKGDAKGTVTVSGVNGQGAWHQTFDVGASTAGSDNAALRQLWARERIRLLGDYAQFGETDERKKQITSLGLTYNLLTAYTSFIAVDSQVRNPSLMPTTVTQPLPMPEGVSNAAVGRAAKTNIGSYPAAPSPAPSMHYERTPKEYRSAGEALADHSAHGAGTSEKTEADLRPVVIHAITSDRPGLNLSSLQSELEAKLTDPALLGALADLPKGAVLELQVDANGKVVRATFQTRFPNGGAAATAFRGMTFRTWNGQKSGLLRITLRH